jgi:hypothetical protein
VIGEGGECVARVREAAREDTADVANRLRPYIDTPHSLGDAAPALPTYQAVSPVLDELGERAVTFLAVMPPRQRRATIEGLVSPNDPERGRRAVDALIEGAFVAEDERGCLRLLATAT